MKKNLNLLGMPVVILLATGVILAGCNKREASVTETDVAETEEMDAVSEEIGEVTEDTETADANETELEVETFDVNNPTKEMQDMFLIMDAVNMCMYENGTEYTPEDADFFWQTIQYSVINSGLIQDEAEGITYDTMSGETTITPELAKQFAMAIFGTDELPTPPQVDYGVTRNADGNYTFGIGDRGLSTGVLHSWEANDDGTYTVEVELQAVGEDNGREMAKFNYMLTDNYYGTDTETTMFAYSIVDAVASDDLTIGLMRGTPYFTMIFQDYGNDLICEIPFFSSLKWSDELDSLNKRITSEIMDCYAYDSDSTEGWAEIKAYPMTSEEYLQIVITAINYPNYATDGEVYSYVYDIQNECALNNDDGLALAGITEQELYDAVAGCYKPDSEASVFNHAELSGFRIKDDSVDFYLKLYIDNSESDNHDQIATYSMQSGQLTIYDSEVLIPDDEIDVMTPPLTHGGVG